MCFDGGIKKCEQTDGGETCWKATAWKTMKGMGYNIKMNLEEIRFNNMNWFRISFSCGMWC
jgi:hypothetical protein